MISRRRLALTCVIALVGVLAFLLVWRLEDQDLDRHTTETFVFTANGASLAGQVWLPDAPPRAAVVLVHGDGPQDRTSAGGYAPLINALLDAGIAVAAWDKPGVGDSLGNWLDQSMADRAVEVQAALGALRRRLEGLAVGALGFSQAGWVLPRLSSGDADFLVLIGPAVSWQRQGVYFTRTRLRLSGEDAAGIDRRLARSAADDDRLFGPAAADPATLPDGMGLDRWGFIRRNRTADATDDLRRLDVPLLALWGAEDLNVDAAADAVTYRETVAGNQSATRIVIVPGATHGLLKAGPYNAQLVSDWPWSTTLRFLLEGRHAYAPGVLDMIRDWIIARAAAKRT